MIPWVKPGKSLHPISLWGIKVIRNASTILCGLTFRLTRKGENVYQTSLFIIWISISTQYIQNGTHRHPLPQMFSSFMHFHLSKWCYPPTQKPGCHLCLLLPAHLLYPDRSPRSVSWVSKVYLTPVHPSTSPLSSQAPSHHLIKPGSLEQPYLVSSLPFCLPQCKVLSHHFLHGNFAHLLIHCLLNSMQVP